MRELEFYGDGVFYVEFGRWPGKKLEYRIFKKHYMPLPYDANNEGHPYQLLCGEVNEHPNVVCFETKDFLKFTIDSLNKNVN